MKTSIYSLATTSAALMCLLGAGGTAKAAMIAAVCQDLTCTNSPVIVTDNQAGDTIPGTGAINFSVAAFGFNLVVNTSQSKPVIGSASEPQLDLTFTATGTGTIFLYLGDTGFTGTLPMSGDLALAVTNSGGSGTATGRAWGGNTNNALTFNPLLVTTGPLSDVADSEVASASFTPGVNPYSLSLGVQITRTTAGTSTGDLNFSTKAAVPEPGSLVLTGLGFTALAFAVRRRKTLTQ